MVCCLLGIVTQLVVFPVFGIETGLAEHLTIGLAFVGLSLAPGYLLRRLFERLGKGCVTADTLVHESKEGS